MRLNKFIAKASQLSRRAADAAIEAHRVTVNGQPAQMGQSVVPEDEIHLDGQQLQLAEVQTIMLNKPVGYVCSRDGQGSQTIYDLLPLELHHLNPVGRLDKDSSGLLLMTNDGDLANQLTHPSFEKEKYYQVQLDRKLSREDQTTITQKGVQLEDGLSKFHVDSQGTDYLVTMHEGRNRQIRRTFEALGYKVNKLRRTEFGPYKLGNLPEGQYQTVVN